uniref:Paired amphipathic helix protein Sin3b (inferred by orthology to a human protein) n=1 Tax=Strongyloides venezuelensis TaxID=75913 RepID=A0A0K0F8K4_STRVS
MGNEDSSSISSTVTNEKSEVVVKDSNTSSNKIVESSQTLNSSVEKLNTCTSEVCDGEIDVGVKVFNNKKNFKQTSPNNSGNKECLDDQEIKNETTESATNLILNSDEVTHVSSQNNVAESISILPGNQMNEANLPIDESLSKEYGVDNIMDSYNKICSRNLDEYCSQISTDISAEGEISSEKLTTNSGNKVKSPSTTYTKDPNNDKNLPRDLVSKIYQDNNRDEPDFKTKELDIQTIVSCELPCGLKVTLPSNLVPKDSIIISTISSTETTATFSNEESSLLTNGSVNYVSEDSKSDNPEDFNSVASSEDKIKENSEVISSLSREISKAIYSGAPSFYNQELNSPVKSPNDLAGTSLTNYSSAYSSGIDNTTSLLNASSPDLIGSQNTDIPGSLSCSFLGNQFNNLLGSLTNEFLVNQLSGLTSGQLNSLAGAFNNTFNEFSNSVGNNYPSNFLPTSIPNTLLSEQESQRTNNDSLANSINTYMVPNFIRESSLTNDLSSFHNDINDKEGNDSPSSSVDGPESKNSKKLQVHDALLYLDDVRKKFQGTDVYNHFLTVMRLFKGQIIDTPEVIKKVADLFKGYPYLVVGFNAFLPTGYMVKLIDDVLYAEEPSGKTWPVYNNELPVGTALRTATEIVKQNALNSQVLSLLAKDPSILRSINNPSLVLSNNYDSLSQLPLLNDTPQLPLPSDISLPQGITESDTLNEQMSKPMAKALLYISKIRAFYLDEDVTYNKFLNILQTYQEIQDSGDNDSIEEIFRSIAQLFASNKDLLKEFSDFIPDTYVSQRYLYLDIAKEIIEANRECTNKFPTLVPNDDFLYNSKLRIKKKGKGSRSYTGLCVDPLSPSSDDGTLSDENVLLYNLNHDEEYQSGNEVINDGENKKEIESDSELIDRDELRSQNTIEKEDIQEITAENCTVYKDLDPNEILCFLQNNENMSKQESEECLFFGNLARQVRLPSEAVTIHNQLKLLDTVSGTITYADDVPYYKKVEHIFRNYPKFKSTWLEMRNKADPYRMIPERVRGPKKAFFQSLKNIGRSYRLLPADYPRPLCSGRTAFEQQFLNDDYVAFPLWLSDEKRGEGICHKKSPTEELYIKLEEERFEYDMAILVTQAGLDVLETFWDKLQNTSSRNRNKLVIDKRFGGTSDTLIERSMHRIYNHHTKFMIGCMIEKPHLFLRNVIERMKQFVEDLTKQKHACNILWREKSDKLFYKAQDYQGNVQRQFDSKLLKGKTLVNQVIEKNKALIKRQQHGDITIKRSEFCQMLPYSTKTFKEASQLILHYVRKHLYIPRKDKIIVVKILCELLPELLCYDTLPYDIDDYDGPILEPTDDNNENVENIEIDRKDMFVYLWDKNKKGCEDSEYNKQNELGKRKRDNTVNDCEPPTKVSKNEQVSELLEEIKQKYPLRSPENYVPNLSSIEYKSIFCNDAWVMFIRHFAIICDRLDTLKRKQDHLIEMWNDEEKEKKNRINKNNVNSKVEEHLKTFNNEYHESELHPDKGHPSTFYDKVYEKLLLFVSGNLKQEPFEDFARNIFTTTSHVLYSLDKFVQVATKNCINAIGDMDEENIVSLYYRMSKIIDTKSQFLDDIELNEQSEYQMIAEELIQRSKIFKLDFVKDTFNPGVSIYFKFIKQASLSDSDDEDDDENAMDIVWREFMDSLETEKLTKHMKHIIRERQRILPRNLKKKAAKANLTREEMNRLPFTHKEPDDNDIWYEGNIRALEKPSDKFYISFVPGTSDLIMRKGYLENGRKVTCETDPNKKRKFENWLVTRKTELGIDERINDFEIFTENTDLVEIIHPKYHQVRLNRYVTELFSSVNDLALPEFEMVDENDIEDEALDEEQESEETDDEDSDDELLEDEQCHNENGQEDDEENDNEDEEDGGDDDGNDDSDGNNDLDGGVEYDENDLEEVEIKQEGTIYEYEGTRYILQHGTDENGDRTLYYAYEGQAENVYDSNEYLDNYHYISEEQQIVNNIEYNEEIHHEKRVHMNVEQSCEPRDFVDEEMENTEIQNEVEGGNTNNLKDFEVVDNVNTSIDQYNDITIDESTTKISDDNTTTSQFTTDTNVENNDLECTENLERSSTVSSVIQKKL